MYNKQEPGPQEDSHHVLQPNVFSRNKAPTTALPAGLLVQSVTTHYISQLSLAQLCHHCAGHLGDSVGHEPHAGM